MSEMFCTLVSAALKHSKNAVEETHTAHPLLQRLLCGRGEGARQCSVLLRLLRLDTVWEVVETFRYGASLGQSRSQAGLPRFRFHPSLLH